MSHFTLPYIHYILQNYDFNFISRTPPFFPIVPIINSEKMNLERRIILNAGINYKYILKNSVIKLFFKQQIPIKNYYYKITSNISQNSADNRKQYGGAIIGINIYFH